MSNLLIFLIWGGVVAVVAIGLMALRNFWRSRSESTRDSKRREDKAIDPALENRLTRLDRLTWYSDDDHPVLVQSPARTETSATHQLEPPPYTEDTLLNMLWKWSWRRGSVEAWVLCELHPFCAQPSCGCKMAPLSSRMHVQGERTVFLCAGGDFSHAVPFEGSESEAFNRARQLIEQKVAQHSQGGSDSRDFGEGEPAG
jgi:hypothetical protein